jgi:Uma2 family endonuclease
VRKVEEYKRHPAIRHIILIEPGEISVTRLSRMGDGSWSDTTVVDLAGTLTLEPPGVELPLAEIYEGLGPLEPATA